MMNSTIRLTSLNAGLPQVMTAADGSTYSSAIAKKPVSRKVRLTAHGLEGDACVSSTHGGPNMKVNVFAEEKYPVLERFTNSPLPRPAFGENFTLAGLPDEEARIGDVLRAGTSLLQISQPRSPCGTLVRFLGYPMIMKWMSDHDATGYYLRVLEPGEIEPDSELELLERGDSRWTIARLNRLIHLEAGDRSVVDAALKVELLSQNWKEGLRHRAERQVSEAREAQ